MNTNELSKFIISTESLIDGIYDIKLKQEVRVSKISYDNMIDFIKICNTILLENDKNLLCPTVKYDKTFCVILNFKNKTKVLSIIFNIDGTYAKVHGMPYISGVIHRRKDTTFNKVVEWLSSNMIIN